MKYTFRPSATGTHTRIADSVRGNLSEHADAVNVQPLSALVNPAAFAAYVPPPAPPAPPPIPAVLPAWRIKAVAALHGLTGPIATVLAALPEPQRTVASLAWNEGNEIARYSPTLLALANALVLDAATLDGLFIEAAALDV